MASRYLKRQAIFVSLMTVLIIVSALMPVYATGTVLIGQNGNGNNAQGGNKVTLCHATGSASNPYVVITVSINAASGGHGHDSHEGDIIPAPAGGCPTGEGSILPDKITLCHATGSATNPYEEITVSYHAATEGHGHDGHVDDIIPVPAEGCPFDETDTAPDKIKLCHASGNPENPYERIKIFYDAATETHGHEDHADDIIPAPPEGCPDVLLLPTEFVPVVVGASTCIDWLVYSTNITGDWEIFRLGELPDNAAADPNLSKGVGEGISDIAPSFSPDHQWITFTSNRDGNWEVYVGSSDGTTQQRMSYNTRAHDIDPAWSPSGQYIAFESTRDGNWELYLTNVTTGVETRLTDNISKDVNAFWSPDGTHLLFQSDRDGGLWQIYELDITTLEVRLVSNGLSDDRDPTYSFDGTKVVFRSTTDTMSVVYMVNLDGTNLTRVSDPAGRALNSVWSLDNSLIGYQSNLDGDMDIYVYEVASGITRLVTDNQVRDYAPTWLCNGSTLVFTSDVDGDANIFNTPALPMDAPGIDVAAAATRMTSETSIDRYALNTASEENATRLSTLPHPAGD